MPARKHILNSPQTDIARRALEYDEDEPQACSRANSASLLLTSRTSNTSLAASFSGRPCAPVGVGLTSAALSQNSSSGHCSSAPLWGASGTMTMYETALEAANAAMFSSHRQKCATSSAAFAVGSLPCQAASTRYVASPQGVTLAALETAKCTATPLTLSKATATASPSPCPVDDVVLRSKATPQCRGNLSLSKRCSLLSSNGGCTASRHASSLQGATPSSGLETWEDVFELE